MACETLPHSYTSPDIRLWIFKTLWVIIVYQVFEYKNNNYYFIIIIVLYSQLHQKIITRCSLYKNLNGMIITLVPREKSRKVACVLNGTEMLSPKATTKKNMLSQTLSRKQLTIICHKKTQNT